MKKAFAMLKKDHQEIQDMLIELLSDSADGITAYPAKLVKLKQALHLHQGIEETLLYPYLTRNAATRQLTLEAYEEHHQIDNILEELEAMQCCDETWKAKLIVLHENLTHHINQEENNLFLVAEQAIAPEILLEIATSIQDRKKA